MKWEKFNAFAGSHLELAPCLRDCLWPITGTQTLQRVVERQLAYVSVRPWDSLDWEWTGYYRRVLGGETNKTFTVYAHIDGHEAPCARARSSYAPDGSSIRQLVSELADWHKEYWATQPDRSLVFDAVTLSSRLVHYGDQRRSADKMALEFYLFPPGFTA